MLILETKDTPIIEKTKELCAVILDQETFKAERAKIDTFMADEAAQKLYKDVIDKSEYLRHLQQQGSELTPEQIEDFNNSREALMENTVCSGYVEAQDALNNMIDSINVHVQRTIELGRIPTEDEVKPQGGCCGGGGCGSDSSEGGGGGCSTEGGGGCCS